MAESKERALLTGAYAKKTARVLLSSGVVRFDFKDGFTFTSGMRSPVYCDGNALASHVRAWQSVLKTAAISARNADVVAGVATSALVHSAALASMLHKPHAYVRKEEKKHGAPGSIAGAPVAGKRVLLFEDTVTTGASMLKACDALRRAEAESVKCLSINTYDFKKTRKAFLEHHACLISLTSIHAIAEAAHEADILSSADLAQLYAWLESAHR